MYQEAISIKTSDLEKLIRIIKEEDKSWETEILGDFTYFFKYSPAVPKE